MREIKRQMEIPLLTDLLVIFGLAVAVVMVCHWLRIPALVGLLLTGVLAGPHGLGLISAVHEVEVMAEVGVVLLLFTIGIEFSVEKLLQIKVMVLVGGGLQVALTAAAGAVISVGFGRPFNQAMFFGFLLALSSTAIVLKIMQERAEIDSPHGRNVLGILIFQDIMVVPMVLLVPMLAGADARPWASLLVLLGKGAAVVGLAIILARYIVPVLLFQVARLKDRELFILAVVFIGLAVAWLTYAAGLSLALGSFLAGLIISESEYSSKALSDMIPFRDIFISLFFVSIGMLLDLSFFIQHPLMILAAAALVLVIKSMLAAAPVFVLGFPLKTSLLAGLALSQVGEFSFILSKIGMDHGLMPDGTYQVFLGVAILTMIATPLLISSGPRLTDLLSRVPLPERITSGWRMQAGIEKESRLTDHLVIVGFGPNGVSLARAAASSSIPYVIIELNPETVRRERNRGEPVTYGDASGQTTLEHAGVERARVMVVAIPDPASTRRIIELARRMNPKLYLIARTPFIKETEPLYRLGADEVIPAELETSVEIFTRVLTRYMVPSEEIQSFTRELRSGGYHMLRSVEEPRAGVCDLRLHMPDTEVATFRVQPGSEAAGKTLAELMLRSRTGATLMAVRRGEKIITNPAADQGLSEDDVAVLLGKPEHIARAGEMFSTKD